MAFLSIGQVWAADESVTFSSQGYTNQQVMSSYSGTDFSVTFNKGTNSNDPKYYSSGTAIRAYGGNYFIVSSSTKTIAKIELTFGSSDGSNAITTDVNTYSNGTWTGSATSVKFTIGGTSGNRRLSGIAVTYETGGDPDPIAVTGVSLDKSEISIAVGKTETLTATVAPNNATNKSVSWSSDDEAVATVDGGIVTAVAEGTANITVTTTDGGKTATCEVTVTPAPAAVNYELVTNVSELANAAEIIIVNVDEDKALSTTQASNNRSGVAVSSTNHVIAAGDDVQVITLEASGDNWKFNVGDSKYLYAASSSGNQLKSAVVGTSGDNGIWSIAIASDGAATILAQGSSTRNFLRYNPNNGSPIFNCYASNSTTGTLVKIFKKVDGTVLPAADLAYAEADQKKLAKLSDAFTAPTLSTAEGFDGTVSFESDNTAVATVNPTTGAVTIVAAGVAVITASSEETTNFKAGSASYTIGVTNHAGTELDPYDAADAKIVIDAVGSKENAYATGIVSNVITTTLPQEGYISFYFSADGATTGQQIEAYKCFGLNSASFEAVDNVKTGATVVITGTLKKYNSTYEFDQNCHLVSYEAPATPKQSIANDQANPYTVAQAITYAADGVTYDLDDYVYVQGVVYDVKSFSNGAMNIFIKDANAENQFELYKCAGINDGSATTPFEALTDVQVGDIVIGYGQLTVYNEVYEFKQGNYLVDLDRPAVAATGVALTATANVKVGKTITLLAEVQPTNATNQNVSWSVKSGDTFASVTSEGVVSGLAAGEAVIKVTTEEGDFTAECTVTVTEAPSFNNSAYEWQLVTSDAQLVANNYYVIGHAGKGVTATNELTNNYLGKVSSTFTGGVIAYDALGENTAVFQLGGESGAWTLTEVLGEETGLLGGAGSSSLAWGGDYTTWPISIDNDGNATIGSTTSGDNKILYNSSSPRFKTYTSNLSTSMLLPQLYVWGPKTFKLSYDANGGEDAPAMQSANNEGKVTITSAQPTAPEGYVFNGWKDSQNNIYTAGQTITLTADLTLLAKWRDENATPIAPIGGKFIINQYGDTAVFSRGNLQYNFGEGEWTCAEHQLDILANANLNFGKEGYNGSIDLFGWSNENSNYGRLLSNKDADYLNGGDFVDWGDLFPGETKWVTPSKDEWQYLQGHNNWTMIELDDEVDENAWTYVMVLFPHDWSAPTELAGLNYKFYDFDNETKAAQNTFNYDIVSAFENAGAVLLPAAGSRAGYWGNTWNGKEETTVTNPNASGYDWYDMQSWYGYYWLSTPSATNDTMAAYVILPGWSEGPTLADEDDLYTAPAVWHREKRRGNSVRLITRIPRQYTVTYDANGATGNVPTDDDTYLAEAEITVKSQGNLAKEGFVFAGWKLGDNTYAAGETVPTPRTANDVVFVAQWEPLVETEFVLVTDVNQLQDGDKVYIVAATSDNAMGAQNGNYRNRVSIGKSANADRILIAANATVTPVELTLGKDGNNFTISDENGYLCATSNSSNNIGTQAELSNDGRWAISITNEGVASIIAQGNTNGRKDLRYNSTSGQERFSCYKTTSEMQAVAIYKKLNVLRAELYDGKWGTICPDRDVKYPTGASFYTLTYLRMAAEMPYQLVFDEIETDYLEGGKPYLFIAEGEEIKGIKYGDAATAQNYNGFYGNLSGQTIQIETNQSAYVADNDVINYYGLTNNTFTLLANGTNVNHERAVVQIKNGQLNCENPPANLAPARPGARRVVASNNAPQITTGTEALNASETPVKMMINGQLFILRGEKLYDATGRLVK